MNSLSECLLLNNLNYIKTHFKIIEQIINYIKTHFKIIEQIKNKNFKFIFVYKLFLYHGYIESCFMSFFYLNQGNFTEKSSILFFNFYELIKMPAFFNLYALSYELFSLKISQILYLNNYGFSGQILQQILLLTNSPDFLPPTYQMLSHSNKVNQFSQRLFDCNINQRSIAKNMQTLAQLIFIALNSGLVLISMQKFNLIIILSNKSNYTHHHHHHHHYHHQTFKECHCFCTAYQG